MPVHLQDDDSQPGRGTWWNTANRFEDRDICYEEDDSPDAQGRVETTLFEDHAKSIIAKNDSPDVGFDFSINPYRGCEHGCIYCYARPTHEYMGYSAGLDFETKIFYKPKAAELLKQELEHRSWCPSVIAMSGVTDPYQPLEGKLKLSRACLEVLAARRNPVVIITKNRRVIRDIDLLASMARDRCAGVYISLTTLDLSLNRILEPRTSSPKQRLETVSALRDAGIPVGVLLAPVIPGLTDHEIPELMSEARSHGASYAGYVLLRLPHAVAPLFSAWLERHYPDRKQKILGRVMSMRDGALNRSTFGERMRGTGAQADQMQHMFQLMHRRLNFERGAMPLSTEEFIPAGGRQLGLF